MNYNRGKHMFILALIIILSLLLRGYHFGQIPNGVNRDEAAIGYTAKLLLQAGRDEHGRLLPLKFESFGDWKQPAYIYFSIPFVALLGLNEISVRLPSLIVGLLFIVMSYLITNSLTLKRWWGWPGLFTACFLALNPWHFHFSHMAVEALMAASFFSMGMYLFTTQPKSKHLWAYLFFGLSVLSYHSALLVVPLWLVTYLLLTRRDIKPKVFWLVTGLFLLCIGWLLGGSWFSPERAKVSGTVIFSMTNEDLWQEIYSKRTTLVSSLYYNQFVYLGKHFINHYIQSFSPQFLWIKGGMHPHYNVPGFGNFYAVEIMMALFGLLLVFYKKCHRLMPIIILLLLAPIPAAITHDAIHSTRSIFMLPAIAILAGFGAYQTGLMLKSRILKLIYATSIVLVLLTQSVPYISWYWNEYEVYSNQAFSGYMKEFSHDLTWLKARYNEMYITIPFESPYIFYAFYTNLPPHHFLSTKSHYPKDRLGFVHVRSLSTMIYPENMKEALKEAQLSNQPALIIAHEQELPSRTSPVLYWKDKSGKTQLVAIELNPTLQPKRK